MEANHEFFFSLQSLSFSPSLQVVKMYQQLSNSLQIKLKLVIENIERRYVIVDFSIIKILLFTINNEKPVTYILSMK